MDVDDNQALDVDAVAERTVSAARAQSDSLFGWNTLRHENSLDIIARVTAAIAKLLPDHIFVFRKIIPCPLDPKLPVRPDPDGGLYDTPPIRGQEIQPFHVLRGGP